MELKTTSYPLPCCRNSPWFSSHPAHPCALASTPPLKPQGLVRREHCERDENVRGLEGKPHKEKLRTLVLFSLEKGKLRGEELVAAYSFLMRGK